jgi:hypothetical protein
MWIAHERKPLALAPSYKKFVAALVIATNSQTDSVHFFVTKPVGEPQFVAKMSGIALRCGSGLSIVFDKNYR